MNKLTPADLHSLESYARMRDQFRARVVEHKRHRRLPLGDHVTLYFEDRLTMQYQVQEMLRVERLFEAEEIQSELDAYNPLIPDGSNWKATMMVEYPEVDERRAALARLVGIEDHVWLQVTGHDKVRPIADEDLDRTTADKTSAVHFLRFELTSAMVDALRAGAALHAGVDHPEYRLDDHPVPELVRESLIADLD
ncbi:MAG: DUF3501 family protein [Chromatiales bacterium]|nr:DUF3501 family protein [Chromatiales bacterium]